MQNEKKRGLFLNLRNLDPEIKLAFKTWCAANDTTMTEAIVQFMKDTVSHKNTKGKKT